MFTAKCNREPAPQRQLLDDVPGDLDGLCDDLLPSSSPGGFAHLLALRLLLRLHGLRFRVRLMKLEALDMRAVPRSPCFIAACGGRGAEQLERADMFLHAAAARLRRGELLGGDAGEQEVAEAIEWMTGQGVRRADRMAAILAPIRLSP